MASITIDPALFPQLRPVLDTNERLLWAGHPDAERVAMESQELLICGLILTALGLSGIPGMGVNSSTLILFGPFVLFGLALLWTPARRLCGAPSTLYAITGERLIIVKSERRRKVQSFAPGDLGAIERVDEDNGSGDLVIACRAYQDGLVPAPDRKIRLFGIPGVREVEALLQTTFPKSDE